MSTVLERKQSGRLNRRNGEEAARSERRSNIHNPGLLGPENRAVFKVRTLHAIQERYSTGDADTIHGA